MTERHAILDHVPECCPVCGERFDYRVREMLMYSPGGGFFVVSTEAFARIAYELGPATTKILG